MAQKRIRIARETLNKLSDSEMHEYLKGSGVPIEDTENWEMEDHGEEIHVFWYVDAGEISSMKGGDHPADKRDLGWLPDTPVEYKEFVKNLKNKSALQDHLKEAYDFEVNPRTPRLQMEIVAMEFFERGQETE